MKFRKKKYVATLAEKVEAKTEETKDFLSALSKIKVYFKDGLVFTKHADGTLDVKTFYEYAQELCKEMKEVKE